MIKVNYSEDVDISNFPDGTKLIKFLPKEWTVITGSRYEVGITWMYDSDEELFQLIALTKHLKAKGLRINLFMPYVPNARMDRVQNPNEVFTLKYFADTINWLDFDHITICNPHSTVAQALFNKCSSNFKCVLEDVDKIVHGIDSDIGAIFFPDEGACKRYGDLLKSVNLPVAFGVKKRDWSTGKIIGIDIVGEENIKGKNVLMVDDICAYGGTFFYSALRLKELGAKDISCYVTHLENSVLDPEKGKLLKGDLIKKIYATNSIFRGKNEKIEIIREF